MASTNTGDSSSYYGAAAFLAFLCVCAIFWMVRTSEPNQVIDDWNVGRDRGGYYVETESHYEKQRGSVETVIGWLAILGLGGGAVWCLARGAEVAQEGDEQAARNGAYAQGRGQQPVPLGAGVEHLVCEKGQELHIGVNQ